MSLICIEPRHPFDRHLSPWQADIHKWKMKNGNRLYFTNIHTGGYAMNTSKKQLLLSLSLLVLLGAVPAQAMKKKKDTTKSTTTTTTKKTKTDETVENNTTTNNSTVVDAEENKTSDSEENKQNKNDQQDASEEEIVVEDNSKDTSENPNNDEDQDSENESEKQNNSDEDSQNEESDEGEKKETNNEEVIAKEVEELTTKLNQIQKQLDTKNRENQFQEINLKTFTETNQILTAEKNGLETQLQEAKNPALAWKNKRTVLFLAVALYYFGFGWMPIISIPWIAYNFGPELEALYCKAEGKAHKYIIPLLQYGSDTLKEKDTIKNLLAQLENEKVKDAKARASKLWTSFWNWKSEKIESLKNMLTC